jgi:hypothetical protein
MVSHPETEDHQMNATRVPCQVRQRNDGIPEGACTTSVCGVRFLGGRMEPKSLNVIPPRSGDQPRR